ncbi:hypothetical protein AVEN_101813-1 [Araneus ventricosus]|uniref:Uncharacterized protein n=1 Tax=Araneus ventricosus TaxID=182803 RepID=A0A4Y2CZ57_ARAVE|nr:hypothetical protein AVEN_101813-1 [Araneus ventricosus]
MLSRSSLIHCVDWTGLTEGSVVICSLCHSLRFATPQNAFPGGAFLQFGKLLRVNGHVAFVLRCNSALIALYCLRVTRTFILGFVGRILKIFLAVLFVSLD